MNTNSQLNTSSSSGAGGGFPRARLTLNESALGTNAPNVADQAPSTPGIAINQQGTRVRHEPHTTKIFDDDNYLVSEDTTPNKDASAYSEEVVDYGSFHQHQTTPSTAQHLVSNGSSSRSNLPPAKFSQQQHHQQETPSKNLFSAATAPSPPPVTHSATSVRVGVQHFHSQSHHHHHHPQNSSTYHYQQQQHLVTGTPSHRSSSHQQLKSPANSFASRGDISSGTPVANMVVAGKQVGVPDGVTTPDRSFAGTPQHMFPDAGMYSTGSYGGASGSAHSPTMSASASVPHIAGQSMPRYGFQQGHAGAMPMPGQGSSSPFHQYPSQPLVLNQPMYSGHTSTAPQRSTSSKTPIKFPSIAPTTDHTIPPPSLRPGAATYQAQNSKSGGSPVQEESSNKKKGGRGNTPPTAAKKVGSKTNSKRSTPEGRNSREGGRSKSAIDPRIITPTEEADDDLQMESQTIKTPVEGDVDRQEEAAGVTGNQSTPTARKNRRNRSKRPKTAPIPTSTTLEAPTEGEAGQFKSLGDQLSGTVSPSSQLRETPLLVDEEVKEVFNPAGSKSDEEQLRTETKKKKTKAKGRLSSSAGGAEEKADRLEEPDSVVHRFTLRHLKRSDLLTAADAHKVRQRHRQIVFGKVTPGYRNYCKYVPKHEREYGNPRHPVTPRPDVKISKRRHDTCIACWRRGLHQWDTDQVDSQEKADSFRDSIKYKTLLDMGLEEVSTWPDEVFSSDPKVTGEPSYEVVVSGLHPPIEGEESGLPPNTPGLPHYRESSALSDTFASPTAGGASMSDLMVEGRSFSRGALANSSMPRNGSFENEIFDRSLNETPAGLDGSKPLAKKQVKIAALGQCRKIDTDQESDLIPNPEDELDEESEEEEDEEQ